MTGVLHPKVALFFLAFLPQFVRPEAGHVLLQFIGLGPTLAVVALIGDTAVAWAAHSIRGRALRNPAVARWRERVTGSVLMLLGIRMAFVRRQG